MIGWIRVTFVCWMLNADHGWQALCVDLQRIQYEIGLQMQGAAVVETSYISIVCASLSYYRYKS
jgi:hypothetical protein